MASLSDPVHHAQEFRVAPWLGWHLGSALGWLTWTAGSPLRYARIGWTRRRHGGGADTSVVSASSARGRGRAGPWRKRRGAAASPDLSRVTADRGLEALSSALTHPRAETRALALETLCDLSRDRAVGILVALLHDPASEVRVAAAEAASRLSASEVVFSLIACLDDPELRVRHAAARAITLVTHESVHVDEQADDVERRAQMDELRTWWKARRFRVLAEALETEERD